MSYHCKLPFCFHTMGVIALLFALPLEAHWYWQSPKPQGYTLRDIHVLDAATAVAVGDQGTVVRTADGGVSWTIEDSGIPHYGNIGSVEFIDAVRGTATGVFPQSSDGSGIPSGFILQTEDGGESWAMRLEMESSIIYDVAFASESGAIAVGVDVATFAPLILHSSDGGSTWERREVDVVGQLAGVAFADADTGVAVGLDFSSSDGLIMRTVDGGQNWVQETSGPGVQFNDVSFFDTLNGMAVGDLGTIMTTADGGKTWVPRESGTALDLHRVALAGADVAVAVGGNALSDGVMVATADGGATWTATAAERRLEGLSFSDAESGMAVGHGGEILHFFDGGTSWLPVSKRLTERQLNAVSFTSAEVGTAVGTQGTIFRTSDGGRHWAAQSSGVAHSLNDVVFVDEEFGMAVGGHVQENGMIIVTLDGGETWVERTPAAISALPFFSVSCTDRDHCTVVGHCGIIIRTDDGGDNWMQQREPDCMTQHTLESVSFSDPNTGLAVGWLTILKTINGGDSWIRQDNPSDQVLRDVFLIDGDSAVIVGGHNVNEGTILHTVDGGNTWTVRRDDLFSYFTAVDFADALHGAAVMLDGGIYRTDDGGENWHFEQGVSGNFYSVAMIDALTGTAVGWGHGSGMIFRTAPGILATKPGTLVFGSVEIGDSRTAEVVVTNVAEPGTGTLELDGVELEGDPDFEIGGGNCQRSFVLPPQASCTLVLRFTPAGEDAAVATLTVQSADGQAAIVEMSGSGITPKPPVNLIYRDRFESSTAY